MHHPHVLDLAAPHMQPVSEFGRALRFDQVRGSSASASATRQFTQTAFDVQFGPKSALVTHWGPSLNWYASHVAFGVPVCRSFLFGTQVEA